LPNTTHPIILKTKQDSSLHLPEKLHTDPQCGRV
jgi:hypothetical protein